MSITGHTENNGWMKTTVMNGTYMYGYKKYHAPYNLTANISGLKGYPAHEYDGRGWQRLYINFGGNIPPSSPFGLTYVINHSSVQLNWECFDNDLSSYRILRRIKYGGWTEVANITSPPPGTGRVWLDVGNATDLTEYHYKIYHMDALGQEGVNDLHIEFDDWVFTTQVQYSSRELELNGSLVVEAMGELTLENVTLVMNESEPIGSDMVEVRSGGKLILMDLDNDHLSTDDRTTVTVTPRLPSYFFGFVVRSGGELLVKNSMLQNSSNYLMETGESSMIFVDGGTVNVQNSRILTRDIGLYLEDSNGSTVDGTEFIYDSGHRYLKAVRAIRSTNISLYNNVFSNSLEGEIHIEDSLNINIAGNDFHCENTTSVFVTNSDGAVIENNSLYRSQKAIYLHQTANATVKSNELYNYKNEGLNLYSSKYALISGNTFYASSFGRYRSPLAPQAVNRANIISNTAIL